ncbi:MAG: helix-turn-helix transcriptional regulator [Synergistaceae bacterium]|nr:helix-turn-helix transcriptional regulator [Synergistaceae bacterium]
MARWNDSDRSPLAMLRVKAGYTQAEASVHMHLGMISLVRYENGMNDITFGIGEQMARLYNVSFEDIRKAVWDTKEAAGKQTIGRSNKARRQKVSLYIKANDTHDQQ